MDKAALAARIAELARLLDNSDIAELSLSTGSETITLRRRVPAAATAGPAPEPGPAVPEPIVAPCPGVFLPRHPLREAPLVAAGQAVARGTVLGLLRAGPLLLQVAAPRSGTLVAVKAAEGDLVGYGTELFQLSPAGMEARAEPEGAEPCPST